MEQKKLYLDMTEVKDCISIYIKDTEIIPAGVTIYIMSVKHKNEEYERYAKAVCNRRIAKSTKTNI